VRVAPKLMGASRRGEREPGKSDQIDARAIGRSVLREGIEASRSRSLQRKEAEGKSRMEAMRCLKRHLARHYHRLLLRPPAPASGPVLRTAAPNGVPCGT
jgi:hypothetical protein